MAAGGVTHPEPNVTNCGGVTNFRKVGALTEAHNLPLTSHGAPEVTVPLLASAPSRSYLEVHGFSLDRLITHSPPIVDGCALASERPGHGTEFDWDALKRHRIG